MKKKASLSQIKKTPRVTGLRPQNLLNLQAGDLVDVIAPASRCPDAELDLGCKFLQEIGLRVRRPTDLFGEHPYLANDDSHRWEQLKRALLARDSKAIWCARGGYGSARLMPELLKLKQPRNAKVLFGLSDITVLHIYLNTYWKWPSWHSPLLSRLGTSRASMEEKALLRNVLVGRQTQVQYPMIQPFNDAAANWLNRNGSTIRASSIVGGNLVLVQTSLGTKWELKTRGKILFLEDIGERGFRLDRSLQHLKQAGMFDGAAAVVLGDFLGGDEPDGRNFVELALKDFFAGLNAVPVFGGLPSGHGSLQLPIPFGCPAVIQSHQSLGSSLANIPADGITLTVNLK